VTPAARARGSAVGCAETIIMGSVVLSSRRRWMRINPLITGIS